MLAQSGRLSKGATTNTLIMTRDTLQFKYGISRGRNSYGYRIVSLYVNGKKEFSTSGGGYDMQGTVLAQYIERYHLPKLLTLKGNHGSLDDGTGYYGLMFWDNEGKRHKDYKDGYAVDPDGACGWSSIITIADAIGVKIENVVEDVYTATY